MSSEQHDQQLLIRYLLGTLPDTEAERLDELSITDDDLAGRLGEVENDLVDSYVRGELSGETLDRFETHYLSSERRRRKVMFADALRRLEDRHATSPAQETPAMTPPGFAPARPRQRSSAWRLPAAPLSIPAWALAGAAVLLLSSAGYLLVTNGRLRQELSRAQSQRASLETRALELQKRLEQQRSADGGASEEAERGGRTPVKAEPLRIASLLLASPTRGLGPTPSLAVPPAAEAVALRLQLETDEFPRYRVALKAAASDRILWRGEKLESTPESGRRVVAVRVPASLLTPRRYTLELTGLARDGSAEPLGTYVFTVVR